MKENILKIRIVQLFVWPTDLDDGMLGTVDYRLAIGSTDSCLIERKIKIILYDSIQIFCYLWALERYVSADQYPLSNFRFRINLDLMILKDCYCNIIY